MVEQAAGRWAPRVPGMSSMLVTATLLIVPLAASGIALLRESGSSEGS